MSKSKVHSAPPSMRSNTTSTAINATSPLTTSHWVTPGQLLGSTNELRPGRGCFVLHGGNEIYAGVVGVTQIQPATDATDGKSIIHIETAKPPSRLPAVGDVVTCRVTKITSRMASVDILVLHPTVSTAPPESSPTPATAASASTTGVALSTPTLVAESCILDESLIGTIRQRDIRAFDVDSVEVYKSFRPNDLVKAQVLSLGDARAYFLSTARNDLGVILATSNAGHTMVPINWEQMQCPVTGVKEFRKVAKIEA